MDWRKIKFNSNVKKGKIVLLSWDFDKTKIEEYSWIISGQLKL